jgi:SAM-dependent methyltransferase
MTTSGTGELPSYRELNEPKADFNAVYNRPDPRAYFRTLGSLDYVIPQEACPVFEKVVEALVDMREIETPRILDIGCSYGVNAALLKSDLTIEDLQEHYTNPALARVDPETLIEKDAAFFAEHLKRTDLEVVGLDSADKAVGYAVAAHLLDAGIAENLERMPPSPDAARLISGVDAVISTGCVGYVTERTFGRILDAVDDTPWIASFVLRMFPYDAIAERLARDGLVTEKLEGATFIQRAFADEEEMKGVLSELEMLGIDPRGKETEGHLHAEFFLSRPAAEAASRPLRVLLS